MKSILHISADFPDPLVPAKTRAVANLIEAAGGLKHIVYSLDRVSWRSGLSLLGFDRDRFAVAYGAPPYGIGLSRYLRRVAEAIGTSIERSGAVPDLIHAHKFSIEGIIAAELAERLGRPFIASLWGDSDMKIVKAKPALKKRYRQIAERAALLLPAAPWTAAQFARELALEGRFAVLPVITTADAILPPSISGDPRLITVLALDSWKRKGLDTLAKAAVLLKPRIPGLAIEVYGSGSPKSLLDVRRMLAQTGAEGLIRLMGPAPHGNVQHLMNNYAGFLMPTRRETYGMVHVEAVLAGVPILFSRDRGIDGLLDGDVGYRCDPSSLEDVAAGIAHLVEREAELKANIKRLQANGALEHLRRDAIGVRYHALTTGLIDAAPPELNLPPPIAADSPRLECRVS